LTKKNSKKEDKKINNLILLIVVVLIIGYTLYINKDLLIPKNKVTKTIIINNEIITANEIEQDFNIAKKINEDLTLDEFIDQKITATLLLQEAKKENIEISETELNKEITELITSFNSEEEFYDELDKIGTSLAELETQIKKQVLIDKLINNIITKNIEVSESEILFFYEDKKETLENAPFEEVKPQIELLLFSEKENMALETYITQLKSKANIIIGEETKKTKVNLNEFKNTNEPLCNKDAKPIMRLFTTTTCPQCSTAKKAFDSTVKKLIEQDKITAYHWELDIGDNTLTTEIEKGIPRSEVELFKKFNSKSTVPTYIMGCKYVRIGNAYDMDYIQGESTELTNIITEITV
jgi:glutaredoxin